MGCASGQDDVEHVFRRDTVQPGHTPLGREQRPRHDLHVFDAVAFNTPLNDWNVSQVTSMRHTLDGATQFNQTLSRWYVSRDTSLEKMFH